jgi:hypothetical protein
MNYFLDPSFAIDSAGAFDIGGALADSPFGGTDLNVGGFAGTDYGSFGGGQGLFQGLGPMMALSTGANSVMAGMQQGAMNKSLANTYEAQNAMFGANFGQGMLAQNIDRFRSLNDPIRAAQIQANAGPYRQARLRENLPALAGKYGDFGAFVA